jgi:hypothetical protein
LFVASATIENAEGQFLSALETLLASQEISVSLPLTTINKALTEAVTINAKLIRKVQGRIVKALDRPIVANTNDIDRLGTVLLEPLQAWADNTQLLLTQLAAKTGLTQIGDPLEQALVEQVVDAPELAYSASLLLALREAMPFLARIAGALEEIRDRTGGAPYTIPGDETTEADIADEETTDKSPEIETLPIDWPEV